MSVSLDKEPIVLDKPEEVEFASILALRSALKLEVRGLKMSRGVSALKIAQQRGFTTKRTKQGALDDVNAYLAQYGF